MSISSAVSERGFPTDWSFCVAAGVFFFFKSKKGFRKNRRGLPLLHSRSLEGPCLRPCQLTSYYIHLSSEDTISFKTAVLCSASVNTRRCSVISADIHCRESVFFSCGTETTVGRQKKVGCILWCLAVTAASAWCRTVCLFPLSFALNTGKFGGRRWQTETETKRAPYLSFNQLECAKDYPCADYPV